MQHLSNSDLKKIREWVEDIAIIGYTPKIEVLEDNIEPEQLSDKEKYWVGKCINDGCDLLNESLKTYSNAIKKIFERFDTKETKETVVNDIGIIFKKIRNKHRLTQEEFADKMGVALTVIKKIEQGKTNLNFEKLEWLLNGLGFKFEIKNIK